MKIVVSLMLVLVMVFSCVGLVACGCEEEEETAKTPTDGGAPAPTDGGAPEPSDEKEPAESGEEEEAPTPSEGDFNWDDIPIYPGADANEDFWATATTEGKQVEIRFYQTDDSVDKVADFYKREMPDNGWDETMWMSIGAGVEGVYHKNNEQDFVLLGISDAGDEGTLIHINRGRE